jgi:FAM32A
VGFCPGSQTTLIHDLDRKKKSKSKEALVGKEVIKSKELTDALIGKDKTSKATQTQREEESPAPGTSTPTAGASSSSGRAKTDAERRFEEIQRRRVRLYIDLDHNRRSLNWL